MSDDTRERPNHAARDASAPPNGTDGNQNMLRPDGHLDAEMVSAWLDSPDDFSEQDRLAIENHLAGCAECRLMATELTAIVRALQTLPLVEPAREFGLTKQQAGLTPTPTPPASRQLEASPHPREAETRPTVESYARARWLETQMSRLRWATSIAVVLFVFFVSVDVLGNIDTGGDDDDADTAADVMSAPAGESDATTSSDSTLMATTEPEEAARNSDEPTPAGAAQDEAAGGSEAEATEASGAAPESTPASTGAESEEDAPEVEEAPPPESAGTEATATAGDETVTMLAPDDTEQASQTEEASDEVLMYSGGDSAQESSESDTLHLIELALVIAIAWLIVAMIALPRMRRPVG